jgi:NitT/TauT family transport system ATP-binding protein
MPAKPQIHIAKVQKIYRTPDRDVHALKDIDIDIFAGEFVSFLGPSGCGKSTLLNAIGGFSLPTSGTLNVDEKPVTAPGPDRGMVFQEYALFPWMTVAQNIEFGMEIQGRSKEFIKAKADELLGKLQLKDFRDRFPKELSGGMRQRVAIARVLALDPPIMLMDEPFGALDALTRRTLQDELIRIWTEFKKTICFVTHGLEESIYLSDRIVVMTYRPGTVKAIVPVDLPRPRHTTSPEFNELKNMLGQMVMEEQSRHQKAELAGTTAD